ncbi:calcium/sodium antiporter [Ruminococcus sp.]|uniref:calcium/sodium antiporter n=1 Tax=Ruminococcus sp. TaxID=41978 RepID=UPI00388D07C2
MIFLCFALGLVLIVRGGDRFVDAAAWMAAASGIPPFIIGATVVSVATTLPEILVSLIAALSGHTEMAAGNAIGSVTANTALILALSVIFLPGRIDRVRYLPKTLLLIAGLLTLWAMGLSGVLTPPGSMGLFVLFVLFVCENLYSAKAERRGDTEAAVTADRRTVVKNLLFFLLGAGEIILGSRLLVDNGTLIARDILHIDERIVSLTMVAVGTSLPELVTAIGAIIKRRAAITAGNILGANIIDVLLILPLCALSQGGTLAVSRSTLWIDLPFCLLATLVTLVPTVIRGRFSRVQGFLALALYLMYILFLFLSY